MIIHDYRTRRPQKPRSKKMPATRDSMVRPPHRVFQSIDMKGGDTRQCWPWLGYFDPLPKACVFTWRGRKYRAPRLVYALRNGIPFESVPPLVQTCGNNRCCNPYHLIERHSISNRLQNRKRSVYVVKSTAVSDDGTIIAHQVV